MIKVLFICHGNICRSPMAEFVMKDLVKKAGLASQFHIESAATSREEIGNPVYPPARRKLAEKVSNFESRLPSPQSELAAQTMKDPYIFDFIPFKEDMVERDIEQALVKDVTKLLLELGTGFAFLGNQYHLNVGGDDFYIDLLFYNLNLRCYVVIELKTGEFKQEYAGQLNIYLSAVDGNRAPLVGHGSICVSW